jgi:hypothetical protein
VFLLVFISVPLLVSSVEAADKNWSGGGDGSSWSDKDNWYPASKPKFSDDVTIDAEDASVVCNQTFKAKSIAVGGRETSTLSSENYIYGTVTPDTTSETAILNRSQGTITLKGAGVLTLKGRYKDSEESLTPEPSFLFWIE